MSVCNRCGEEVVFRYINGTPTPIHLSGGWCSGHESSSLQPSSKFNDINSYLNPNASCPVCGESVFFYQSPYGGRVFFDAVGWPWPKHPCTTSGNVNDPIKPADPKSRRGKVVVRDGRSIIHDVYLVRRIIQPDGNWFGVCLRQVEKVGVRWCRVSKDAVQKAKLSPIVFGEIPSVLIGRGERVMRFINERKQEISAVSFEWVEV